MLNDWVLIDTSAWIEFFRKRSSPTSEKVAKLVGRGQASLCGVVYAEILHGLNNKQTETIKFLEQFHQVGLDWAVYEQAGLQLNKFRRKGIGVSLSDCLIAMAALNEGLPLLTLDKIFEKFPDLTLYH